ncbi:MAG: hypothetical protein PWQ37_1049 [Candidatus Petromonas sp.]|nr:hypothetical protein [Candidatus Petromonas sp.]
MVSSMTGYGRGETKSDSTNFVVEMKSVNHRYNDIIIRMPKKLSVLEERIRKLIKSSIKRGRIETYISIEESGETDIKIAPNVDLVKQYYASLKEIKNEIGLKDEITLSQLTSFPDVFKVENEEQDEELIWQSLKPAINDALSSLIHMRKIEGSKLAEDIKNRGKKIYDIVKSIESQAPQIVKEYRDKLMDRVKELTDGTVEIDENRIAVEVSIYADRSNITEELVRLCSHLEQLNAILDESGAIGRKIDFLIQEMNREINTIGSKSSDIEISRAVIEVKSELEKIREQVQNIE